MTTQPSDQSILTINTGSSSLKAAIYAGQPADALLLSGRVERIGRAASTLHVDDGRGTTLLDQTSDILDYEAALQAVLSAFGRAWPAEHRLAAIGHRVVHGGSAFSAPQRITPDVLAALDQLVPLAPNHMPQALAAMRATERAYPALPHVACFDTAFHRGMPRVAQLYALPATFADAGVVRYGFHGLSYEYILRELRRVDPAAAADRVIIAHLGNGASMAAVRDGASLDTTMGFTPAGGLVMGTRPGDLDPGVPLYLVAQRKLTPEALNALIEQQSGLLGVSGISADMRDLLSREASDPRAAAAIELFCYSARKFVGALAAALGGLDTLVFTAGIGERAAPVRGRICAGLEFLGIQLDDGRNATHAPIISAEGSRVIVRVMRTDEDLMIAQHTRKVLALG
jgi:acetate kinase